MNWITEHIEFLEANYKAMSDKDIAVVLGCTPCAVSNKRKKLGLVQPENRRCFPKNNIPWNKGLKGLHVSPATEFKKGSMPANTKYDGCISIRWHKRTRTYYKFIRISNKSWMLYHRWIWEQRHGPIPPSHNIQFKDGDTLNCNIDNLYMISRAKQSQVNCRYDTDKQLARMIAGKHYRDIIPEIIGNKDLLEIKKLQNDLNKEIKKHVEPRKAG